MLCFADLDACRAFAHKMNQVRDAANHPDRAVHAGSLYAMGLIDEASHVLMAQYRKQFDPEVMTAGLDWFAGQVGVEELDQPLPDCSWSTSRVVQDGGEGNGKAMAGGDYVVDTAPGRGV